MSEKFMIPLNESYNNTDPGVIENNKQFIFDRFKGIVEHKTEFTGQSFSDNEHRMYGEVSILAPVELRYIKELLEKIKSENPNASKRVDEIMYYL